MRFLIWPSSTTLPNQSTNQLKTRNPHLHHLQLLQPPLHQLLRLPLPQRLVMVLPECVFRPPFGVFAEIVGGEVG